MEDERERVADVIEHAANISEQLLDGAVKAQRALAGPESHPDFDGVHCVEEDCGVEIPAARLALGYVRCVDCKTRLEAQRKQFRRAVWL